MSHYYLDGVIYHERFAPKKHVFVYPFFMLNIDLNAIGTLKNRLFSSKGFNLFSFKAKDHFGTTDSLQDNIKELQAKFGLQHYAAKDFITLPRIANFVFNPLSVVLLYQKDELKYLLAEVHNYNSGRIVYKVALEDDGKGNLTGDSLKDMYVSPFFVRDGLYKFKLTLKDERVSIAIDYFKDEIHLLNARFSAKSLEFSTKNTLKLFVKHTFLTIKVVTRTLWQSLRLKLKGLRWQSPQAIDQQKRY